MPSSAWKTDVRSEEHTSELQSLTHLVCRLLLENSCHIHRTRPPARQQSADRTPGSRAPPCHSETLLPCHRCSHSRFFFFNDTATTEIYTLSLHDALPI